MRALPLFAVVLLSVPACTGSDNDGGDAAAPDAEPPSGVWSYRNGGIVDTDCDSTEMAYVDPDTSFVLTNNGDGTFTVDQGQEEAFDCTVNGDNFDCPNRLFSEFTQDGIDATVTWQVSISGEFMGDTEMEGEQVASIACEGSQCGLAETVLMTALPCSYTVAFTAEFSG